MIITGEMQASRIRVAKAQYDLLVAFVKIAEEQGLTNAEALKVTADFHHDHINRYAVDLIKKANTRLTNKRQKP